MTDFTLHRRAQDCIAQGALTNSKRPSCFVQGVYPTHLKRGQGCWVWDHQGKRYLDFINGLGANILGYAHTQVNQAIAEQMHMGASLSLSTHVEIEVAEKLKEIFPFLDLVKFLKTGGEATSAAIRIARGKTGRLRVASSGYHGWADHFVSLTPPAVGITSPSALEIELFDERLMTVGSDLAAVIVEPVTTDASDLRRKWLQRLRAECTRQGVLLIFDEVVTGFRWPKFSVSNDWGIIPDLIVVGKAMGNGMPIAAVGGKKEVMNGSDYFISSTFAGETLSLAAAKRTIELLQTKYDFDYLWKQGQAFLDEFNGMYPEKIRLEGYPSRGAFVGDPLVKALFWQESCLAGMLFGASWSLSFPAAEAWRDAMGSIKAILAKIRRGEVPLKGEMPQQAFAQRVRQ